MTHRFSNNQRGSMRQFVVLFVALYIVTFVVVQQLDARGVITLITGRDETTPAPATTALAADDASNLGGFGDINFAPQDIEAGIDYDDPFVDDDIDFSRENAIRIPSIGLEVPVVSVASTSTPDIMQALDDGVVHYQTSALPGDPGMTVLLGHSAPPGWPQIRHDWVFSKLNNLEVGDEFIVFYAGREHTYRVDEKRIFGKGQEAFPEYVPEPTNTIALVSCWPPGIDFKRIGVKAVEI